MISDERLILYYYQDGLAAREIREVELALSEDADLAARYEALRHQFEQWRIPDAEPVPEHLGRRWHDSIRQAARLERASSRRPSATSRFASFGWFGTVAVALVLGIGIGVHFSRTPRVDAPAGDLFADRQVDSTTIRPAAFSRGLQLHLQQSRLEIVRLSVDAASDRTLLLERIVEQNRMFQRAAEVNKSPKLARVLRAFEPILLRLASEDTASEDAEDLRKQLAFEINVVLTKLVQDQSDEAHSI